MSSNRGSLFMPEDTIRGSSSYDLKQNPGTVQGGEQ